MDDDKAYHFLAPAVPHPDPTARWADLGCGTGTFTRALSRLVGPGAIVFAVDRDPDVIEAIVTLEHEALEPARRMASVRYVRSDFLHWGSLPGHVDILLANALHFVPEESQGSLLGRLTSMLRENGRIVIIEYDRRVPNQWVPYPISRARLTEIASAVGLPWPRVVATVSSAFGPPMYCAVIGGTG